MRIIHISQYQESKMKLAKPIYDAKGRVLLAAENRVHPVCPCCKCYLDFFIDIQKIIL
ncbi:hypothetical protein DFP93_11943 [Aneurinibacillus soli]|uniref:Uncharacterized protein n=1 Tax=Aneurinibacillus soli TaxID=1500254 RepID=A0A0U5CA07_9BACL|nr:hypothetical protein DFP93_11943 [Aneurinibacillus soli]BAU29539.1 hypothetical protein CB4_03739 [Aneurinibacillus soli]